MTAGRARTNTVSHGFSVESRLIHAGTDRTPGEPTTPPLVPASIYVSEGEPRPSPGYGRETNPGVERSTLAIARRQMPAGFGPLLSFEVETAPLADRVVAGARLILPATSFGGVESTWERRARWAGETAPDGLIRLSVGVEPAADLITDIDRALDTLEVP
jgi:hypothetical protein